MRSFLSAAGVGLVAAASVACGKGITEQDLTSAGGGSGQGGAAGMGGSMGVAGSGAAGRAGSGTIAPPVDAGPEAGGPPAFTYPAGCPVPNPIAAKPGQKVAIQSVNFNNSEIVLKNISNTTVVMPNTPPRTGWQWCNFPAYWDIADVDVTLEPGQTFKFLPYYNTSGVRPFFQEEGELGIYTVSGSFDEANLMVAFVSWGTSPRVMGREGTATLADLWTFDNHIQVGDSAGFVATGNVKTADGFTAVPARCLVAPPNP